MLINSKRQFMNQPRFKTTAQIKKADYGEFILEPLPQGYGHTLGNALRRVLLTSLEGVAVTRVKIKGVRHPFSTLTGLRNDIVDLLLNLKKIRLLHHHSGTEKEEKVFTLKLGAKGLGEFKASAIKCPAQLEVVNQDLSLGYLTDKNAQIEIEMTVEKGYGYRPAEEENQEIGVIPMDAIFTPVIRVAYEIEQTRVGRRTDFDRLLLKIWTDGTLNPEEALKKGAQILVAYFQQVYQPVLEETKTSEEKIPLDVIHLTVEEIGLPTRVANALIRSGYKTVRDLSTTSFDDIKKAKSIGNKSLKIIKRKLHDKGIDLT